MNYLDYYFSKDLDYNSLNAASKVPVGTPPNAGNKTTPANRVYPSGMLTRKSDGGGGDSGGGGGDSGDGSGGGTGGGGGVGGGSDTGSSSDSVGDTSGPGPSGPSGDGGGGNLTYPSPGGVERMPTIQPAPGTQAPPSTYPGTNVPLPMTVAPGTGPVPYWTNAGGPMPVDPNAPRGQELDEFTNFLKEIGADQYSFWKQNYKPLEEQQIAETKRFMSPEFASQQAAQAGADVTGAFAGKRAATEADLQSMGLGDPSQGRYQAYRRGLDIAEAGTLASAKTGARRNAELMGYGALSGLVGQGNQKLASGVGITGAAANLTGTKLGMQQRQYEFGNTFNQRNYEFSKQQEFDKWKADQASEAAESAGYGKAAGAIIGGVAGSFFGPAGTMAGAALGSQIGGSASSKEYKTHKRPYKGGLAALDKMPVERWKYKKGVADEGHHIGPYAEDFKKATGKGDGKSIAHQDSIGVTMAAVKELHDRVKSLEGKRGKKMPRTSDPSSEMNQTEGEAA